MLTPSRIQNEAEITEIDPSRLYKTAETRAILGCGNTKLWSLIAAGELDCLKLGRCAVIPGSSIGALIERLPRYQPRKAAA